MKKIVNKLVPIMLAFAMMITFGTLVKAETPAQTDGIENTVAETAFAGGNGTAEDPWQIATADSCSRSRLLSMTGALLAIPDSSSC